MVSCLFFRIILAFQSLLFGAVNFKKVFFQEKSYHEKSIRSHRLWTQNSILEITHAPIFS